MFCFGCLRHGHSSRECQRRLSCATCGRQHPTVLHDESYLSRQRAFQPPQSNSYQRNAAASNSNNRPPQSYFEASMPLRFQQNNQPTNSPLKSTPQQAQKSSTSMNMNIRQLSVSAHLFNDCTGLSLSPKLPWPTQTRLRNARFSIRLKFYNRPNSELFQHPNRRNCH